MAPRTPRSAAVQALVLALCIADAGAAQVSSGVGSRAERPPVPAQIDQSVLGSFIFSTNRMMGETLFVDPALSALPLLGEIPQETGKPEDALAAAFLVRAALADGESAERMVRLFNELSAGHERALPGAVAPRYLERPPEAGDFIDRMKLRLAFDEKEIGRVSALLQKLEAGAGRDGAPGRSWSELRALLFGPQADAEAGRSFDGTAGGLAVLEASAADAARLLSLRASGESAEALRAAYSQAIERARSASFPYRSSSVLEGRPSAVDGIRARNLVSRHAASSAGIYAFDRGGPRVLKALEISDPIDPAPAHQLRYGVIGSLFGGPVVRRAGVLLRKRLSGKRAFIEMDGLFSGEEGMSVKDIAHALEERPGAGGWLDRLTRENADGRRPIDVMAELLWQPLAYGINPDDADFFVSRRTGRTAWVDTNWWQPARRSLAPHPVIGGDLFIAIIDNMGQLGSGVFDAFNRSLLAALRASAELSPEFKREMLRNPYWPQVGLK